MIALHGRYGYRRDEFYAVTTGLGYEPVSQLTAGDAVGEPRVVVDPVTDPGLAAERVGFHHHGVDAFPGGIDGGGQPSRTAPHDDQVVGGPVGLEGKTDAAGQRLVARVH